VAFAARARRPCASKSAVESTQDAATAREPVARKHASFAANSAAFPARDAHTGHDDASGMASGGGRARRSARRRKRPDAQPRATTEGVVRG
jgi:hypothetical protein